MSRLSDCVLVGISCHGDEGNAVLMVGRKAKHKDVEVINVFQGKEAIELYEQLVTKKKGEENEKEH